MTIAATVPKLPDLYRMGNYQDVLNSHDNMLAQIINSEACLHAGPADVHEWTGGSIHAEVLMRYGRNRRRSWGRLIQPLPEFILEEEGLAPGIAGWRGEGCSGGKQSFVGDDRWVSENGRCVGTPMATREVERACQLANESILRFKQ